VTIARRIHHYLAGHVQQGLSSTMLEGVPAEMLANYIAGAELSLIAWWLEYDPPYSASKAWYNGATWSKTCIEAFASG
jgi:hypothetical protein